SGCVQCCLKGAHLRFMLAEYMSSEYLLWFPPDIDPDDIQTEIEELVANVAKTDSWLRENPPQVNWKQHWPANNPGAKADEIVTAIREAHEAAHVSETTEVYSKVAGFCAVADTSFLSARDIPAISYGPGDLRVAHADDEYVSIDETIAAAKTFAHLALKWCGFENKTE